MRIKWVAAAVLAAGVGVGPWAAPAQAQPPGHNVETIECEGLGTKVLGVEKAVSEYDRIMAKQQELRRTLGVPVSLDIPGPGRNTTGGLLQGNL